MGFVDYVVDYFRGPAGPAGADGAIGPEGPSALHVSDLVVYSAEPSIPDGYYTNTVSLPDGALYVSTTLVDQGGEPAGTMTASVVQLSSSEYRLRTDVSGKVSTYEVRAKVLFYLP